MYAIIQDSGRQVKVVEGEEFDLDYREAGAGDPVTFDRVLAVSQGGNLKLGKPTLSGAKVSGTVVAVVQGPKLVVQKARRRKNMRRRNGHRQMYTRVKIEKIEA